MKTAAIQPQAPEYTEVVRIATNNNFNCTPEEWEQLDCFAKMYPTRSFFINCNVKTELLETINDHPYQAVITANPDLVVDWELVNKLSTIEPSKVAFTRVKWVPGYVDQQELINDLSLEGPVVITLQRWNSKASLLKYTSLEHYKFECNRFRLHGKALAEVQMYAKKLTASDRPVYICDRNNLGCGGCGLCSRLTLGKVARLSSLNLSTSGECSFECPDCYAKTMQNFQRAINHRPIVYDTIKQNAKQAGQTEHIKKAKAAQAKK
jgi:hypothetical protein